jgi:hypothetical protein
MPNIVTANRWRHDEIPDYRSGDVSEPKIGQL